jgi:hypothetical protein
VDVENTQRIAPAQPARPADADDDPTVDNKPADATAGAEPTAVNGAAAAADDTPSVDAKPAAGAAPAEPKPPTKPTQKTGPKAEPAARR